MPVKYFIIDPYTRWITVPSAFIAGVYHDKDVNVAHFRMLNHVNDIDFTDGYVIRINYINPSGDLDVYYTAEIKEDFENRNYILFDWIFGENCFTGSGKLRFTVCIKKLNNDTTPIKEFNSRVCELYVYEGIESSYNLIVSKGLYADLLDQLQQEIDKRKQDLIDDSSNQAIEAVTKEQSIALKQIADACDSQVALGNRYVSQAENYMNTAKQYADELQNASGIDDTTIYVENDKLYCSYRSEADS